MVQQSVVNTVEKHLLCTLRRPALSDPRPSLMPASSAQQQRELDLQRIANEALKMLRAD